MYHRPCGANFAIAVNICASARSLTDGMTSWLTHPARRRSADRSVDSWWTWNRGCVHTRRDSPSSRTWRQTVRRRCRSALCRSGCSSARTGCSWSQPASRWRTRLPSPTARTASRCRVRSHSRRLRNEMKNSDVHLCIHTIINVVLIKSFYIILVSTIIIKDASVFYNQHYITYSFKKIWSPVFIHLSTQRNTRKSRKLSTCDTVKILLNWTTRNKDLHYPNYCWEIAIT